MAYVAPKWKDGAAPAISAAALQAISDAIVGAETKNASQDSLIAALQTAVGGKGQVEVGSYVGTGTYGASNPNSITFSFAPKLVMFLGIYTTSVNGYHDLVNNTSNLYGTNVIFSLLTTSYALGNAPYYGVNGGLNMGSSKKSSDGKTLSWYVPTNASAQLNNSNSTYYWVAFG